MLARVLSDQLLQHSVPNVSSNNQILQGTMQCASYKYFNKQMKYLKTGIIPDWPDSKKKIKNVNTL